MCGKSQNARRNRRDAHLQQQFNRRLEPIQTDAVVRALFKPSCVRFLGEFIVKKIARIHNACPSDVGVNEPVQFLGGTIENRRAFRCKQPLMSIGGEDIDVRRLDINLNCTEALNRVNDEPDIARSAQLADSLNVIAEPGGEFNVANRHGTGARINSIGNISNVDASVAFRHHARLNAVAFLQTPPRVNISRKLNRRCDDVVPGAPIDTVRRDENPLRRILHERNLSRIGIKKARRRNAALFRRFCPNVRMNRTVHGGIFHKRCHRLPHPPR